MTGPIRSVISTVWLLGVIASAVARGWWRERRG